MSIPTSDSVSTSDVFLLFSIKLVTGTIPPLTYRAMFPNAYFQRIVLKTLFCSFDVIKVRYDH